MTLPVSYVEMHTADLPVSAAFFGAVFGWTPQPAAWDAGRTSPIRPAC